MEDVNNVSEIFNNLNDIKTESYNNSCNSIIELYESGRNIKKYKIK